ncbi:divergent PAP2 family protein [Thalassobacillus devorans]|uniref:divergent PAP2 family protein n=1 Tax=Thalassobacillus devorans TaxID=279813 RepID=UPI000A1C98A5|nr:divergent PAP2 family protein [Thalassobacillus devorans]
MELLYNFPLWSAIIAILFAQAVKVPIRMIATRDFNPGLAFSTGGMPSSHSAAVTALATAVGLQEGFDSSMFGIATVFSIIVMFDSTGVRRQSGEQAIVLNLLINDFQRFVDEAKLWNKKQEFEKREEIRELLGHQPIEVFFGGVTGILLSIILYYAIF